MDSWLIRVRVSFDVLLLSPSIRKKKVIFVLESIYIRTTLGGARQESSV